jgi:hypothetical protein
MLWRHDLFKVLSGFDRGGGRRSRAGNALIWPSR